MPGTDAAIFATVATMFVTGGSTICNTGAIGYVAIVGGLLTGGSAFEAGAAETDTAEFVTGVVKPVTDVVEFVSGVMEPVAGVVEPVAGVVEAATGVVEFVAGVVAVESAVAAVASGVTAVESGVAAVGFGVAAVESGAGVLDPVLLDEVSVALGSVFGELVSADCGWVDFPSDAIVLVAPARVSCSDLRKFAAMVVAGWLAELVPWLGVAAPWLWEAEPPVAVSAKAIAPPPLPTRRPAESAQTPAANRKCVVEMMISSILKRPRR